MNLVQHGIEKSDGGFTVTLLPFTQYSNVARGSSLLLHNNIVEPITLNYLEEPLIADNVVNESYVEAPVPTLQLGTFENESLTLTNEAIRTGEEFYTEEVVDEVHPVYVDTYINNPLQNLVALETIDNYIQNEVIIDNNDVNNAVDLLSDNENNLYYIALNEANKDETVNYTEVESNPNINETQTLLHGNENQTTHWNQNEALNFNENNEINYKNNEINYENITKIYEAFKCNNCDYATLDKNELVAHIKECILKMDMLDSTKEKVMFMCGKCSNLLPSIDACRQHMIEEHNFQTVAVDNENSLEESSNKNETLDNKKNINQGKYSKKDQLAKKKVEEFWLTPKTINEVKLNLQHPKNVKCARISCSYMFKSVQTMTTHFNCHVIEPTPVTNTYQRSPQREPSPLYACTFCELSFKNWPSCSLHLWRKHSISIDVITCPVCFAVTTYSVSKMTQHLARHWRGRQQENDCGTCKSKVTQTPKDDVMTNLPRWYSKIRCEICTKMFSDSKTLKKHVQAVHKKIKPFICNVCNHTSASKNMMQLHMRQHTREKPYACDYCEYRTGDHNTLRRHRMRHTGERPYTCPYCEYVSIQSIALKQHLKSMHPNEAPPACPHKKSIPKE